MIQFLILCLLIVGFVRLVVFWGKRGLLIQTYQQVGRRYLGKKSIQAGVSCATPLSHPVLSFNYRDIKCSVSTRRSKSFPDCRRSTKVVIDMPSKAKSWEATTDRLSNWRAERWHPITFDNSDFEPHFKVVAKQPATVRQLLNDQLQWPMEQLRRCSPSHHVSITVHRRTLAVTVPHRIGNYQQLGDLIRLSLKIYDQLALQRTSGIEFTVDQSVTLVAEVNCPICSESIQQDMVTCVRCQTPHCLDCWQYNGQCATYACLETRFLDASTIRTTSTEPTVESQSAKSI